MSCIVLYVFHCFTSLFLCIFALQMYSGIVQLKFWIGSKWKLKLLFLKPPGVSGSVTHQTSGGNCNCKTFCKQTAFSIGERFNHRTQNRSESNQMNSCSVLFSVCFTVFCVFVRWLIQGRQCKLY